MNLSDADLDRWEARLHAGEFMDPSAALIALSDLREARQALAFYANNGRWSTMLRGADVTAERSDGVGTMVTVLTFQGEVDGGQMARAALGES